LVSRLKRIGAAKGNEKDERTLSMNHGLPDADEDGSHFSILPVLFIIERDDKSPGRQTRRKNRIQSAQPGWWVQNEDETWVKKS